MTQITTSTGQTSLGYAPQNKVVRLFDGSYLVGFYDLAANAIKLVQVTTPGGTPSFTTLGTTFAIASSTLTDFDLFSSDTSSSTDIWLTIATNTGGTTAVVKLSHTIYTNTGTPTFATWDALTTVPTLSTSGGEISSVVWNGTYLIVAWRDNGTNYSIRVNYTTTKAGTGGWLATGSTVSLGSNATSAVTHAYPVLLYDPTIAATVIIYSLASGANGTEQIFYRVLPDGNSPAVGNWGSQGSVFGGSLNLGGGNLSATWDHVPGTIHVVWCDSTAANTKSPGYIPSASINTTTKVITWGTAIAVGTAATANTNPTVGVDGAGTVHVLFASAAVGSNSTIGHATVASPYTSASSVTTLGTASDANNLPHIPQRERFNGYVPLLYQFTKTSAYSIQYDNSFSASNTTSTRTAPASAALSSLTLTRTAPASAALSSIGLTRTAPTSAALSSVGLTCTAPASALLSGSGTTVTCTAPASAALLATNQATAPASTALSSSGNTRTAPASAELTASVSCTAPASAALSRTSTRTAPSSAAFQATTSATAPASALLRATTAATAPASALLSGVGGTGIGGLAVTTKSQTWSGGPTGSPGTETDVAYTDSANGGWKVGLIPTYGGMPISSIYEIDNNGDSTNQTSLSTSSPDGHIHWLDQVGSAFSGSEDVTFNSAGNFVEQAPTGTDFRRYYQTKGDANDANGLQWTATVCIYPGDPGLIAYRFDLKNPSGSTITLAGSDSLEIALLGGLQQADTTWAHANGFYNTIGGTEATWPVGLTSVEPDYVYITPGLGSGITLGQLTAKKTSLSGLGWSSLQVQYLVNANRLKVKVQGTKASILAGATETVYLLNVLRRNLTSSDAAAIAADYINSGTPTTTVGSFTTFSYDERAYQFAASSNQLTATLSLSGTGVTARYKPIIKVTGWTRGLPSMTWGGVALTKDSDYRAAWDATNSILYLQLYFDVVASGATSGQKNNAALDVQPPAARTAPASAALVATAIRTAPASAALQSTLTTTAPTAATLQATNARTAPSATALQSTLITSAPASVALSSTATRTATASAALQTTRTATAPAAVTLSSTTSRSAPASAAFQSTVTAIAPVSAALQAIVTRTAPSSVLLQATTQASAPASAAVSGTNARTAPASALLSVPGLNTQTCTAPASAAFSLTQLCLAPASATMSDTVLRTAASSAALASLGLTRTASTSVALSAVGTRTAPASAALAATGICVTPASAALRSTLAAHAPAAALLSGGVVTQPSRAAVSLVAPSRSLLSILSPYRSTVD